MKGQAEIVDYIFSIALSVVVFVSVVAVSYSIYRQQLSTETTNELRQVVLQTSDSILKMYDAAKLSTANPSNGTVVMLSQIQLQLPNQVAQRNYKLILQSTTSQVPVITSITAGGDNVTFVRQTSGTIIVAETVDNPVVTQQIVLPNVGAFAEGVFTSGGNATLTYYRYNFNGTSYDTVLLGGPSLILHVTSVS